jgi:hypothetical protein
MANLNHMPYLQKVAASDVEVIQHKEKTYQGSWKEAGGRSAWFMFRRNMDRLVGMMAPPPARKLAIANLRENEVHLDSNTYRYLVACLKAEDIFSHIEAAPGGEDGTALACLRDLRRYALLIEAEMVARGSIALEVVPQPEYRPGTPEDGGHHARHEPETM